MRNDPIRADPSTAADGDIGGRTIAGPAMTIRHLTKRYGSTTVLDDLTFRIEPGRVTGFLGPNGSGKSTTMKVLLGLARADDGEATIDGSRYRDLPDPAATVGAVLTPDAVHPGRSGRDHLRVLADATGAPVARVDELLETVGLAGAPAKRRVGAYSLGMAQRLSLAAALLHDPPALVLDEPANGLDPQGVHDLRDLLRSRADRGGTILVSSHLLGEVELLADDLVVIDRGRLVAAGSVASLRQGATIVRTPQIDELAAAITTAGATVRREGDDTLVVGGLTPDEVGGVAFEHRIRLRELTLRASSLEEMFLAWTGDGRHPNNDQDAVGRRLDEGQGTP